MEISQFLHIDFFRVPVSEQVSGSRNPDLPSVMVPIGVLKRNGSTDRSSVSSKTDNKSVMFSDGIRPGGDLTELDGAGSEHRTLGKRPGRIKAKRLRGRVPSSLSGDVCSSRMPATGLPLVSGGNQQSIYRKLYSLSVYLFVCPIITQEPLVRFAFNFNWRTRETHGNILSLVLRS